jgi:hypothetical protein
MKHQTIDAPFGLTIAIFGPASIRHNDLWTLRESDVNGKFAAIQEGNPRQFKMYGDCIYLNLSHVRSRHNVPTGPLRAQDVAMASCRESIEWHCGQTDGLFKYTDSPNRLQIKDGHRPLKEIYFCRVLLRNCHVCLYHNQTSQRLNGDPPNLAEHLV